MKVCSKLRSILDDRNNPIRVIIKNLLNKSDRKLLRQLGLRESELDKDRTYVGTLKPSQIALLEGQISDGAKIEIEPCVPRSQH